MDRKRLRLLWQVITARTSGAAGGADPITALGATFTRASTAYDTDAGGLLSSFAVDAPRNATAAGLLIEGAATNLTLRSTSVGNAGSWASPAVFTLNTAEVLAPDGTQTATKFSATGAGDSVLQNHTVTASTVYTWSLYVRLGTMAAADYKFAAYNNTALAFIATDIVPNVTPIAGGWVRLSYTVTTPVGCTSLRLYAYRNSTGPAASVYLWGAQLELGSVATSFVPTSASTVTRALDSLALTGSAFTAALGTAVQGWVIVDVMLPQAAGSLNAVIAQIDDGTQNQRLTLRNNANGTNLIGQSVSAGNPALVTATATLVPGVACRLGMRWGSGVVSLCKDGGAVATTTSGILASGLNALRLGGNSNTPATENLNGRILGCWTGQDVPSDAAFQAMCVPGAAL